MSLQNSHQVSDVKVMLVKGADGKGIESIEKTGTSGLIDTYTITYTDGTKTTYNVENGNGIDHISKTGSTGNVDTYTIYYTDGTTTTFDVYSGTTADAIGYDNTDSGMTATNVQDAIDELNSKDAGDIFYDNTSSGITATNVQNAIDEVNSKIKDFIVESIPITTATIPANSVKGYDIDIHKNNYTPIAIVGFHGANSFIAYTAWYINYTTEKASISARNFTSSPYSGLASIDVLYKSI